MHLPLKRTSSYKNTHTVNQFSVWPIFSTNQILNVYFMKTANILLYGYIAVYGYVLNYKDPGVFFVQFVCKVTQCACARFVPHEY